jgi:hypothetical protein
MVRGMSFYLNATMISSPVCKSFNLTALLRFLDFRICAASKARSFRSRYVRGTPSMEI